MVLQPNYTKNEYNVERAFLESNNLNADHYRSGGHTRNKAKMDIRFLP